MVRRFCQSAVQISCGRGVGHFEPPVRRPAPVSDRPLTQRSWVTHTISAIRSPCRSVPAVTRKGTNGPTASQATTKTKTKRADRRRVAGLVNAAVFSCGGGSEGPTTSQAPSDTVTWKLPSPTWTAAPDALALARTRALRHERVQSRPLGSAGRALAPPRKDQGDERLDHHWYALMARDSPGLYGSAPPARQ
jgi:hypothetical protein